MVTIKDIAGRLGVSVSTVSKGLNGAADISGELRHTVINTAVEMGYAAKRVQNGSHKKLCIFLKKTDYEPAIQFNREIILGFQQAAACDGRDVSVIPYPISHKIAVTYDVYMLEHGFSGAFFIGAVPEDNWTRHLSSTVIPTVFLGTCRSVNPYICQVNTDFFNAVDAGISHLVSLNHKKIAFLNDAGNPDAIWLQRAYDASICSAPLTCGSSLYTCTEPLSGNTGVYVKRFVDAGATAIICGSDPLARTVMQECTQIGLSIPGDISVIGFGGFASSPLLSPPLTTISPNWHDLGKGGYYALSALFQKISVGKTLLRAELILRDSTAPCSRKTS